MTINAINERATNPLTIYLRWPRGDRESGYIRLFLLALFLPMNVRCTAVERQLIMVVLS